MRAITKETGVKSNDRMKYGATALALFGLSFLAGCSGGNSGTSSAPAYSASFREAAVPVSGNVVGAAQPGSWPDDLDSDAQGNIWFAMHHANEIGRMSSAGVYTGFTVPTASSGMDSIAVDRARNAVWVSENDGNNLAKVDMATGAVTEIPVPTANAQPGDIRIGPDGTVWFGEGYYGGAGKGRLARLDAATNTITEIPLPTPRDLVDGIQVDSGGAVWFIEFIDNRLGRYANGQVTEFSLPRPTVYPTNLAIDAANCLWVSEQGGNAIARFDSATQQWREFPIPTANSGPSGVMTDAAGNVWFTEFDANKIGLLPAGSSTIVDFAIPTPNSGPEDIHILSDGSIAFTEQYGNKIGRITVTGLPH